MKASTVAIPAPLLCAIAAQACSLDERIELELTAAGGAANAELVERRWQQWCETLATGDAAQVRRRLEWDGLAEARVRQVLGGVEWPDARPLPAWTATLEEALLAAAEESGAVTRPFVDPADPLAFEDILLAFVDVATRRLRARARDALVRIDAPALAALERELLKQLTFYGAHALQLEFVLARSAECSALDRLAFAQEDPDDRTLYFDFVQQMREGGLVDFFAEYAVLARQLAEISDRWVDAAVDLAVRLADDWTTLEATLAGGAHFARVVALKPALSDPHRGRRTVVALTFDTGHQVIYKPKDLGIEAAFQELLGWLNALGELPELKTLAVIARSNYGWVEFVEQRTCASREEVKSYFLRAGALLCVVYLLEGVDCHRGNIVSHGAHPVLVDCEALMQPRQRLDDIPDGILARFLADEQLSHSVLRSGMLPSWQIHDNGGKQHVYDVSALGGAAPHEEEIFAVDLKHINTDRMDLVRGPVKVQIEGTGATLDGAPLLLVDYVDDLLDGLRQTYRAIRRRRRELVATDGPLARIAHAEGRFIYRDTQVYSLLCRKLTAPEYQRDGVSRSIQLDLLGRVLVPQEAVLDVYTEPSSWWPIFAAERRSLQAEDIPYYRVRATENVLVLPSDRALSGLFEGPSYARVLQQIEAMDEHDLEQQVRYVRGAVYTMVARDTGARDVDTAEPEPTVPEAPEDLPALSPSELVAHALRLADEVVRAAVDGKDSATWIAPQFMYRAERYQLQPLNNELYTGVGGIALFLAAAAAVSQASELAALALRAVYPLRSAIEREEGGTQKGPLVLGACTGLGSYVYVLTKMAQFLEREELERDALRVARLITAERVESDTTHDIFDGNAGAILGLLALHDFSPQEWLIERALTCARRLLTSRSVTSTGHRAWTTLGSLFMTGFSHGNAGIAYALLRLHHASGHDELLAAAREAIAYEDELFDAARGNWPDMRSDASRRLYMSAWCHGAPGIALARIGGLASFDNPTVRRDIDAALEHSAALPLYPVDYVCCGNMGIVDILFTAARKLQRSELQHAAERKTRQVVARATARDRYALDPKLPPEIYNPNLFQGNAGIGYTLLRLAAPETVPALLLWE